jgi:hypothetical protein
LEKCSFLPAQLNLYLIFNRGSRPRKAKILTTGIHRVFRGLKFEPDPRGIGYAFHGAGAGIGQKGAFLKGLSSGYFLSILTQTGYFISNIDFVEANMIVS